MPKPNLFIIGAMKSGTSSLHSYLATHPSIYMSDPKEPSYFLGREQLEAIWPAMAKRGYWKSEATYLDLFAAAGDKKIIGESSTSYTKLPIIKGIPERIALFNEGARLIYLIRNPVERAVSHYWHRVHLENEYRSMEAAIKSDPQYLSYSDYALQLEPYIRIFGRDRILVIKFEELACHPVQIVQGIYKWLGVEHTHVPPVLDKHNVTPLRMNKAILWGLPNKFRHSKIWNAIGPLIPAKIRQAGRLLSDKRIDRSTVSDNEARDFLIRNLEPRVQALARMLRTTFPEWTEFNRSGIRKIANRPEGDVDDPNTEK